MISIIDTVDGDILIVLIVERLSIESLAAIMNFKCDDINEYDEIMSALSGLGSYKYAPKS